MDEQYINFDLEIGGVRTQIAIKLDLRGLNLRSFIPFQATFSAKSPITFHADENFKITDAKIT